MRVIKSGHRLWRIVDIPAPFDQETDDYDSSSEAHADLRGMERFFKHTWPKYAKFFTREVTHVDATQ